MATPRTSYRLVIPLILAATFLAACPPKFPLEITSLEAAPDPIVGKVITLTVEIRSTADEDDVMVKIELPEGVRLIEGNLEWRTSLRAGHAATYQVSLCVLYPGDWRIFVGSISLLEDGQTRYVDYDTIHLISTSQSGHSIPGSRYTFTQGSPMPVFTPSPVPTPATCT